MPVFSKPGLWSLCTLLAAVPLLNGCFSEQEVASAREVVTALPVEIVGCTFVGNVDIEGRAVIQTARLELKIETARLGGTHVVETHAYATLLVPHMLGVAVSGRAYKCPPGKGPKLPSEHAEIPYEQPSYQLLMREGPYE